MATGSGTGSPVSGSSSATLNTLRDRVRTQLEAAAGFPDPLQVAASGETLTTLRDRVELQLQDTGNARWATGDLDEAIEKALEEYNVHSPPLNVTSLTLAADGREVDISSIPGLLRVFKVEWPYDSTDRAYPPNWVQFEVYPGKLLYIDSRTEPATGEKVRIWYTRAAVLNGLNAATSTTVPEADVTFLINGACFYAARARMAELAETLTVDDKVIANLDRFSEEHGKAFRYGIRMDAPAWQRYQYAFDQGDIDEGLRWALGRFNEIAPQESIITLTLTSAGREVSLSTVTDLVRVTRVWTPYTSTSPEYPPNWVPFEQWGSTLYIDTESEPASGDVVRIWYERLCTLNGLDSATSTTVPDDAETLIVTGAVGFVAQERVLEAKGWTPPRRFQEWSAQRLQEFERALEAYARRASARYAGTHPMPAMDRWDHTDSDATW